MKFRKDINGLRAIAIIGVVLLHARIPWLPGGMAGVDIFFVISGFLMTSIILKSIETKKFSLLAFYTARANKIIPPLAVLCLTLLIFGWFFIKPSEHKILIEDIVSSLSFFSNVVYLEQWLVQKNTNAIYPPLWLMHTWSLSVEWQFYLIYPLILILMHKYISMQNIKRTLILLTIVSFVMGAIMTYKDEFSAYYLLHYRTCGMLLGGLAYLYPMTLVNKKKKLIQYVGLLSIILTYFFYPGAYIYTPWPGYLVFFPIIGAFLVLQAQHNESIIIGNAFFQKIGARSYSIYLWHLPIIYSIDYFEFNRNMVYLAIPLSFFVGFLSHHYTEKMHFNTKESFFCFLNAKPTLIILFTLLCSFLMYQYDSSDFIVQ